MAESSVSVGAISQYIYIWPYDSPPLDPAKQHNRISCFAIWLFYEGPLKLFVIRVHLSH